MCTKHFCENITYLRCHLIVSDQMHHIFITIKQSTSISSFKYKVKNIREYAKTRKKTRSKIQIMTLISS